MTNWTTDSSSVDYGVWRLDLAMFRTPAGVINYSNVWLGNFLAAANPPASNPTPNAFRVYPSDGLGRGSVKPYLEQVMTHVSGPNPPTIGGTTFLAGTVSVVN